VVPTLSVSIGDFLVAHGANVADPTPACPMAFGPRGSEAAVNGYGFMPGASPATARTTISGNAVVLARVFPTVNGGVFRRADCR
jgi:hypothetical protein